jgi:hypothetical protein
LAREQGCGGGDFRKQLNVLVNFDISAGASLSLGEALNRKPVTGDD